MKPVGENKADIDRMLYDRIRGAYPAPQDLTAHLASNYNRLKSTFGNGRTMKRYGTREDLFQQTILKLIYDAANQQTKEETHLCR
ncbi:MAG: hypothetical protein LBK22_01940 [Tannerella sp.]|jgi:hypothetical protein|nr:hypothetical protein [Tannerella sp.]